MAKVFLDTNVFIDLVEKRRQITLAQLDGHDLCISPLSVHILMYITKRKVPYLRLNIIIDSFFIVPFDKDISNQSRKDPTKDFEDNVQLNSAAAANCDLFLTNDKKLLKMKFFENIQILPTPE